MEIEFKMIKWLKFIVIAKNLIFIEDYALLYILEEINPSREKYTNIPKVQTLLHMNVKGDTFCTLVPC